MWALEPQIQGQEESARGLTMSSKTCQSREPLAKALLALKMHIVVIPSSQPLSVCLKPLPHQTQEWVGPGMTEQHGSGCAYVVEEGEVGSEGPGRVPQFSWGLATQNPPEGQLW